MNADGFSDLVERFEFLRRIARRNASVLGDTRDARIKVKGMTVDLKELRTTYSVLARDAAADRDRADAIRTALLNREQTQLRKRDGTAARLVSVRGRIAAIERRQARGRPRGARRPPRRPTPRRSPAGSSGGGRRRRRGRRRPRGRRRQRDRHDALRLGRRPRRRLGRLRLLGLDQLRARRGRPALQPARLGRLHELGRARPGPPDHGLRQRRPRVHGRRRPPLRHERAVRRRHPLDERDAQHARASSPATRRGFSPGRRSAACRRAGARARAGARP